MILVLVLALVMALVLVLVPVLLLILVQPILRMSFSSVWRLSLIDVAVHGNLHGLQCVCYVLRVSGLLFLALSFLSWQVSSQSVTIAELAALACSVGRTAATEEAAQKRHTGQGT